MLYFGLTYRLNVFTHITLQFKAYVGESKRISKKDSSNKDKMREL